MCSVQGGKKYPQPGRLCTLNVKCGRYYPHSWRFVKCTILSVRPDDEVVSSGSDIVLCAKWEDKKLCRAFCTICVAGVGSA